jgi:hypothetical protein
MILSRLPIHFARFVPLVACVLITSPALAQEAPSQAGRDRAVRSAATPMLEMTPGSAPASETDPSVLSQRRVKPPPSADAQPTTQSSVNVQRITGTTPSGTNTGTVASGANAPRGALSAEVIEVAGTVEFAIGDADPLDLDAWQPVTEGMRLAANTQVRTGMRSRCTLQFGEGPNITVIQLRRATLAKISDYRRTVNEQRIRIGLGYGAVRGGSSEGTLRSDVVVDSTVATLAKRGTEGWEIEIEPVSGTFRISLSRSGLVEALSKEEQERRLVSPGEYATDANIARMWINQEIFDRAVGPFEAQSLSPGEFAFMTGETTGFASLGTGANQLFGTATRRPRANDVGLGGNLRVFPTLVFERAPVRRPEGNFGMGPAFRVLVPRTDFARVARRAGGALLRPRR